MSPKLFLKPSQLVINCGRPAWATTDRSPATMLAGSSGRPGRNGIATVFGTTPTKPATLVLAPAIGLTAEGTSSTYTPGDRYWGMIDLPLHARPVRRARA